MTIHSLLTPYNHNHGTADRIRYLVIHYVGALGGAEANCRYYASGPVGASAHYFCDFDGSVWQSVKDEDIAWHCGGKRYRHPECRNRNSIGIELCVRNKGKRSDTSRDWYFEDQTVAAAAELTKLLMKKYQIPADHVVRHYDVTGKICPNPYVYNHTKHTWDGFLNDVREKEPERQGLPTGWQQTKQGTWSYYHAPGALVKNDWLKWKENWYWFDGSGSMVTDVWYRYKDRWYYLGSDGAMLTGLQSIDGNWYYLDEEGAMAIEPVILTPDKDGALQYPGLAEG